MICLIAQRGGRMPISCAVASITLDELAIELLPAQVVIAIDEVDIEYLLWERRRSMNADLHHAVLPSTSSANERILPVVVFGDTVIPPVLPIVVQGDRVMRPRASIRFVGIRPGRSYRAIQATRDSGHEVLVCFAPEREIASYRGSEAQQLP